MKCLKKPLNLILKRPRNFQEQNQNIYKKVKSILEALSSDIIEQSAIQSIRPSLPQVGKFVGYEDFSH